MSESFLKGDTVKLKSGGPIMTITNIGDRYGEPTVWCVWFEKTKKIEGDFPPEALEKATPSAGLSIGTLGRG